MSIVVNFSNIAKLKDLKEIKGIRSKLKIEGRYSSLTKTFVFIKNMNFISLYINVDESDLFVIILAVKLCTPSQRNYQNWRKFLGQWLWKV